MVTINGQLIGSDDDIILHEYKLSIQDSYDILTGARQYISLDQLLDAAQTIIDDPDMFTSIGNTIQCLLIDWVSMGMLMVPETHDIMFKDQILFEASDRGTIH